MRLHICGKGIEIECEVHGFDCLTDEDEREVGEFEHERWRYRTMRSAGNSWSILSGMAARLHNAVRMAYPKWRAQVAVLKLFGICAFLQYPYRPVMQLMQKHSKQYPKVYTSQVQECIVDAFHHDANLRMIACMIKSMGGWRKQHVNCYSRDSKSRHANHSLVELFSFTFVQTCCDQLWPFHRTWQVFTSTAVRCV